MNSRDYMLEIDRIFHEGASASDRFNDLQKQGFMRSAYASMDRASKPSKAKKPERPIVGCTGCMDWHREGKHNKDAATRKANIKADAEKTKQWRIKAGYTEDFTPEDPAAARGHLVKHGWHEVPGTRNNDSQSSFHAHKDPKFSAHHFIVSPHGAWTHHVGSKDPASGKIGSFKVQGKGHSSAQLKHYLGAAHGEAPAPDHKPPVSAPAAPTPASAPAKAPAPSPANARFGHDGKPFVHVPRPLKQPRANPSPILMPVPAKEPKKPELPKQGAPTIDQHGHGPVARAILWRLKKRHEDGGDNGDNDDPGTGSDGSPSIDAINKNMRDGTADGIQGKTDTITPDRPFKPSKSGPNHPHAEGMVLNDRCPVCFGDLDTGWECNKCGFDAIDLVRESVNGDDDGYLYHATNHERAHEIATHGKLLTHKPSYGTDQREWPDGSTEKRSYFSADKDATHSFAPEYGKEATLRVHHSKAEFHTERHTGDVYSKKPIAAHHIEIEHEGKWHPLHKFFHHDEDIDEALEPFERRHKVLTRMGWEHGPKLGHYTHPHLPGHTIQSHSSSKEWVHTVHNPITHKPERQGSGIWPGGHSFTSYLHDVHDRAHTSKAPEWRPMPDRTVDCPYCARGLNHSDDQHKKWMGVKPDWHKQNGHS